MQKSAIITYVGVALVHIRGRCSRGRFDGFLGHHGRCPKKSPQSRTGQEFDGKMAENKKLRLEQRPRMRSSSLPVGEIFPGPCAPNLFHLFEERDKRKKEGKSRSPQNRVGRKRFPVPGTCRPTGTGSGPWEPAPVPGGHTSKPER
jgi:hypothetical protein